MRTYLIEYWNGVMWLPLIVLRGTSNPNAVAKARSYAKVPKIAGYHVSIDSVDLRATEVTDESLKDMLK